MRPAFLILALCGAATCAILLWSFLIPLTGVTGTSGAALGAFAAAMICLGGFVKAAAPRPGPLPALLTFLILLAILGTSLAAFFLLPYLRVAQAAVYGLMILALLSLIAGAARVAKLDPGEVA